jgi:hypothetical protein
MEAVGQLLRRYPDKPVLQIGSNEWLDAVTAEMAVDLSELSPCGNTIGSSEWFNEMTRKNLGMIMQKLR